MKFFMKMLLSILSNEVGAVLLDDNLQKGENFPKERILPGEYNTKIKVLKMKRTLDTIIALNDEINGPSLPEGALVLDAYIRISGTAGATGIFTLGHRAGKVIDPSLEGESALTKDVVEDPDAFVQDADAGGQAVLKRAAAASILGESLGKVGRGGLQVFAKCTEVTGDTDNNSVLFEAAVFYSLEF